MPTRILVTGATGFLGGRTARHLVQHGFDVIGTGRDAHAGVRLEHDGVRFAPVDLADSSSLSIVCHGVDTIVHCAALSTAWAPRSAYESSNIAGTKNLLSAALEGGVRRFVHVSTPAVLSEPKHQLNLSEDQPRPDRFTSLYGETKAAAERLVETTSGIETAVIRPKAIYGPGDSALLPRLIAAAARGRLPIVGDGTTVTDITHVDDVVAALALAVTADRVSGAYHVTGPEPVRLWDMLSELMPLLNHPAPSRRLSVRRAMCLAIAMETASKSLRSSWEPPLTRYKVAVLAYSQTLDTRRAHNELGYTPAVSLDAGLESVLAGRKAGTAPESKPPIVALPKRQPSVDIDIRGAGTVRPPAVLIGRKSTRRVALPVLMTTISHPIRGLIHFDAGYGPTPAPGRNPFSCAYRLLLRPESAANHNGEPTTVIVSHPDPDHIGGLTKHRDATVVMDVAAWIELSRPRLPWRRMTVLPPGLAARVLLIDTAKGPIDVFDDGSVIAVGLPGHAPGHIGLVVSDDHQYLLCGDGALTRDHIRRRRLGLSVLVAHDRHQARATVDLLNRVMLTTDTVVVPSHCPEAAALLVGPEWSRTTVRATRT